MTNGINFNGYVNLNGITKDEFLKNFEENDKINAESIFDKFNTNNTGDSQDKLDVKEQTGLLAFLKKLAGEDTTISEDEFNSNSSIASQFGFETKEILNSVVKAYESLTQKYKKKATFGSDGKTVTVDNTTYTYNDNAEFQSETTVSGSTVTTQRYKQKYDLVHLTSNWRNQRKVGNAIANNTDGYEDIKDKKTAEEVLNAILEKKELVINDATEKEKLLKTFIKFNPSVFDRETGAVWLDADWTKLDFPEINDNTEPTNLVSEEEDLSDVLKPSTQGWYNTSADGDKNINSITINDLQNSETTEGNKISSARYVLDKVLNTKMNEILSDENKAKLLGEIIKRNLEVFNEYGTLKSDVTPEQIQNIKIPSMNWIKSKYGVEADDNGGYKKQKGSMTILGRNGYYAVKSDNNSWLYYDPLGREINGDDFQKKCPNIYQSTIERK